MRLRHGTSPFPSTPPPRGLVVSFGCRFVPSTSCSWPSLCGDLHQLSDLLSLTVIDKATFLIEWYWSAHSFVLLGCWAPSCGNTSGHDDRKPYTLRVHALGGSPPAFHLTPGTRLHQTLSLHPTREGSRDDRQRNRLGCEVSADGGVSCAWPLLVGRKAGDGASHDAKAAQDASRRQATSRHTKT
jgi:hypothetical protein